MHFLLEPTAMLVVAASLLVLVASFPAASGLGAPWTRLRGVVPFAAMVGGMVFVGRALSNSSLLPKSSTSGIVRYAYEELERATAPNVLVVDGGSYAFGAVNAAAVEGELRQLGYEARVIRMAAKGVNHFERFQMQDAVLRRVKRRPTSAQRWLYLSEVQLGYDVSPLAQFDTSQDTTRAYTYLTPQSAWFAARALLSKGSEVSMERWEWPLLRHAMINGSNAGALHRLAPAQDRPRLDGTVTNSGSRRFKFKRMYEVRKMAWQKPPPNYDVPSWLFDIREPRTRRLWRRFSPTWVYFGVPTTDPVHMAHIRNFCRASEQPHCLVPTSKDLLKALDTKRAWLNATHLNSRGARAYSRWLARALVATGALKR